MNSSLYVGLYFNCQGTDVLLVDLDSSSFREWLWRSEWRLCAFVYSLCMWGFVLIVRVLTSRLGQFLGSCGCGEVNSNLYVAGLCFNCQGTDVLLVDLYNSSFREWLRRSEWRLCAFVYSMWGFAGFNC